MTKVIAVSTNKGGVLKTTIVTNLACVLAKHGKKVLIVDTDNQGNAALQFGINPDDKAFTVTDAMMGRDAADIIFRLPYKGITIDLLAANDDLTFLDHDVWVKMKPADPADAYTLLREALAPVKAVYDYVLIDTAPNLGLATGNALVAADTVLIPFQPETNSMRSLVKILAAITDYRSFGPLDIMGVLPTLIDTRPMTVLHSVILQECRKYCELQGVKVLTKYVAKSVKFASSVHFHDRPASLREDTVYDDIARELALIPGGVKYERKA